MKNKECIVLTLVLFLSFASLAQEKADVFEIARKGTAQQVNDVLKSNPKAFNTTNPNGFTPLILACYRGNNEVAKILIANNCEINAKSEMGSALMACIVKGNNEIATLLIQKKADLNTTDSQGTTALMYAVQFKNAELVKLLLENKANKTIKDEKGKTAFEYAVFSGEESIINLLK